MLDSEESPRALLNSLKVLDNQSPRFKAPVTDLLEWKGLRTPNKCLPHRLFNLWLSKSNAVHQPCKVPIRVSINILIFVACLKLILRQNSGVCQSPSELHPIYSVAAWWVTYWVGLLDCLILKPCSDVVLIVDAGPSLHKCTSRNSTPIVGILSLPQPWVQACLQYQTTYLEILPFVMNIG